MHGEEPNACGVDTRDDKVGANMALIAEKVLLKHRHAGHDARLTACGEGVEFEIRGDDGGCEFGVGGCTRSCTPDVGGDVMEFFAILKYGLVSETGSSFHYTVGRSKT